MRRVVAILFAAALVTCATAPEATVSDLTVWDAAASKVPVLTVTPELLAIDPPTTSLPPLMLVAANMLVP